MTWLISLIHIHWILIYPVGSAIQRLIVIVIACLPTKHVGVHMNSFKRVRAFQIELEFGNVGFWGEGKTGAPGEKPRRARERTINKTQPTYGVDAGSWTLATLVGGERSHHCAILAPLNFATRTWFRFTDSPPRFYCFPSSLSSFYSIKIKSRDVSGANVSSLKLMRFFCILFVRSREKQCISPLPPPLSEFPAFKKGFFAYY